MCKMEKELNTGSILYRPISKNVNGKGRRKSWRSKECGYRKDVSVSKAAKRKKRG